MRNPLCGFGSFREKGHDRVSGSPDETLKRLLQLTRGASFIAQTLMIIKWRSNTVSILPACLSSPSCWSKGTGNACGHASFRAKPFTGPSRTPGSSAYICEHEYRLISPLKAIFYLNRKWNLKSWTSQLHFSCRWTKLHLLREEWFDDS